MTFKNKFVSRAIIIVFIVSLLSAIMSTTVLCYNITEYVPDEGGLYVLDGLLNRSITFKS